MHPYFDFLSAAPDGIIDKYIIDYSTYKYNNESLLNYSNNIHPLVGQLIEIKCPTGKKINTVIQPHYYHQVQM